MPAASPASISPARVSPNRVLRADRRAVRGRAAAAPAPPPSSAGRAARRPAGGATSPDPPAGQDPAASPGGQTPARGMPRRTPPAEAVRSRIAASSSSRSLARSPAAPGKPPPPPARAVERTIVTDFRHERKVIRYEQLHVSIPHRHAHVSDRLEARISDQQGWVGGFQSSFLSSLSRGSPARSRRSISFQPFPSRGGRRRTVRLSLRMSRSAARSPRAVAS